MQKFDFTNPAIVKLCLLCEGVRIHREILKEVGNEFAEDRFRYHRATKIPKGVKYVPSEILLPEDIVCSVFLENKSPWLIKKDKNGKLALFYKNTRMVCSVAFTQRPKFYDIKLSNGKSCDQVAVMYGNYVLAIFVMGWCYFFEKGLGCKFCSLKTNWEGKGLGQQNLKFVSPQIAQEATQIAVNSDGERIKYVLYSSGSFPDNDDGFRIQTEVVRAVKKETPDIEHHFAIMPPNDLSLIKEMKKAGLNTIDFDMEIFDEKLFKKICPGKEKFYGHDKYLEALEYAVKVFGWGKGRCACVAGLEPLDSFLSGLHFLGKKGIPVDINIFHPDPGSELANMPRPNKEYILEVSKEQAKVYKKYNFSCLFSIGGRRGSLDTEIYKGYFD
ncbi:MAG: radical SAM protein [Parcubacteria group bacterium]|nr:radical SAM protein [Parcubacteria group bacterium]